MKSHPARFALGTAGFVVTTLVLTSCGGGSSETPVADVSRRPAEAQGSPPDAPQGQAQGPQGLVVAGEPFVVRVVDDPQQGGMPVGAVVVPQKWRFESQVTWNYAYQSNPVRVTISVENPANEEAFFGWDSAQYFYLQPDLNYYQPGQNYGGLVFARAQAPVQALVNFIRSVRGGEPNLQFVGSKDLPDLPKALNIPPSNDHRGLGVKVTYELNGKPVEEEFYGVFYSAEIPYDGPQGRTYQIDWGFGRLHSFRAPAGMIDARRPVYAAIAKSFKPNPAWQERLAAINQYLADQFNRQLQAGYDQIAAAAAMSRAISANNDAMIASIDRQLQASRTSPGGASDSRSTTDKFSDYIRGVDTTNDPYYGTSQHSSNEQFHWTDGYGNYRNSNSVTYDPSQTEVGNWQLLKNIR